MTSTETKEILVWIVIYLGSTWSEIINVYNTHEAAKKGLEKFKKENNWPQLFEGNFHIIEKTIQI
jgi:hypothetical protein